MKILSWTGREDIAMVYIAEFEDGKRVEFVESVQPPLPREKKWVLIVSTLFGCPVGCKMCDAGIDFKGKLSEREIFSQIDFLIRKRFKNNSIPVEKFKIQFARMGEPTLNPSVLDVLEKLPERYKAPGLIPSLSTVAPKGCEEFFERLVEIKKRLYRDGHFQLQFSIHSTDEKTREWLIPIKKWSLAQIGDYGERFYEKGDRKLTLNFALAEEVKVEPEVLLKYFDPKLFLVKITPLNPTYQAKRHGLESYLEPMNQEKKYNLIEDLKDVGYQVIVSIGELEENKIGSNCGQYLTRHLKEKERLREGYTYQIVGG